MLFQTFMLLFFLWNTKGETLKSVAFRLNVCVFFLTEALQEEACLALAELARGHRENQELICEMGAVGPLVQALRERKISVQVKAATALESIASHNPDGQQCFLGQSADNYLLQLLKVM